MFSWFKRSNASADAYPITADVHSHLLPGLDDGVQSLEEAADVIQRFITLGFHKLITTPHIMSDTYRNSADTILPKLTELKTYLQEKEITIDLEAAAEYYLDEALIQQVEEDKPLLTFGNKYLLFETNFISEPLQLKDFIFMLSSKGYTPVLAHPERYIYLQSDMKKMEDLINRGVLFQLNTSSLTGYYSKGAMQAARELINNQWIHFLGSDCHTLNHLHLLEEAQSTRHYQKALTLPLLNHTL